MRVRLESELMKGVPRWYLNRSEYVKGTGKGRRVRVMYLGYPANAKLKKLVARLNESLKHSKELAADNEILAKIKDVKLQLREKALVKRRKARRLTAGWFRRNVFCDFVSSMKSLRVLTEDYAKKNPVGNWSTDKLDLFLKATRPLEDAFEMAKRLRNERLSKMP